MLSQGAKMKQLHILVLSNYGGYMSTEELWQDDSLPCASQ